jgi:hypothetical protein
MPITRRKRANPPDQPEGNNNHVTEPAAQDTEPIAAEPASSTPEESVVPPPAPALPERGEGTPPTPTRITNPSMANGDRADRSEYTPAPQIESGRRTARGELFRRPPQPPTVPVQPVAAATPPPSLQPPAREISLPLGNLLHLAYNPGYTGSDEARSTLLHHLADESKAGGRARCWNCGSIAIVYDRWNTRSKTFGEIGIAFCEICGVWSVM